MTITKAAVAFAGPGLPGLAIAPRERITGPGGVRSNGTGILCRPLLAGMLLVGALPIGSPATPRTIRRIASVGCLRQDRKSTRLNSSHANISYAVFCLKKKK